MALKPEQAEHINIVNWFKHQFPYLSDDLHHFANERKCTMYQGRILKRMGVTAGVADFFLAIPVDGKCGLWIELKIGKNKPTKEQIKFAERKISRNYDFAFVWGCKAAKEIILAYLKPLLSKRDEIKQISCTE